MAPSKYHQINDRSEVAWDEVECGSYVAVNSTDCTDLHLLLELIRIKWRCKRVSCLKRRSMKGYEAGDVAPWLIFEFSCILCMLNAELCISTSRTR